MAIAFVTQDVARSIYEYAGKQGLPDFESLPPTVQISYIEEAEAAIKTICKHMVALSSQVDPADVRPFVQSVILALAHSLDPSNHD
jgi:hypothetical protein